ncbi:hypothetical protein Emag_004270 [Eimeria magna]
MAVLPRKETGCEKKETKEGSWETEGREPCGRAEAAHRQGPPSSTVDAAACSNNSSSSSSSSSRRRRRRPRGCGINSRPFTSSRQLQRIPCCGSSKAICCSLQQPLQQQHQGLVAAASVLEAVAHETTKEILDGFHFLSRQCILQQQQQQQQQG